VDVIVEVNKQTLWVEELRHLDTIPKLLDYLLTSEFPPEDICIAGLHRVDGIGVLLGKVLGLGTCPILDLNIILTGSGSECVLSVEEPIRSGRKARQKGCRFSLIEIFLSFNGIRGGHANAGLIDHGTQTFEFFEPNGEMVSYNCAGRSTQLYIPELLREAFPYLRDYEYVQITDECPYFGPQVHARANKKCPDGVGAYCRAFSMLYQHLRILEPETSSEEIVGLMLSFDPDSLLHVILNYTWFLNNVWPHGETDHLTVALLEIFIRKLDDYYPAKLVDALEDYLEGK
jgi:hypothetical protein